MATMNVEINVGVEPVARVSKSTGKPYRGVQITGYHRPGYLPLAAAKTLLGLVSDKAFAADLAACIAKATAATPTPAS
jgi:hypothetical protein